MPAATARRRAAPWAAAPAAGQRPRRRDPVLMDGPPFRADHVGSLLRPPELLKARQEHQAGRLAAAELRAIEDQAIAAAVRRQAALGLRGVTDGEMRRGSWHMDFLYQIGGVVH